MQVDLDKLDALVRRMTPGKRTRTKPSLDADGYSTGVLLAATSPGAGNRVYGIPPGGSFPSADADVIAALDQETLLALIARVRELEQQHAAHCTLEMAILREKKSELDCLKDRVRDLEAERRWIPIHEFRDLRHAQEYEVVFRGEAASIEKWNAERGCFVDAYGQGLVGVTHIREIGPLPEVRR